MLKPQSIYQSLQGEDSIRLLELLPGRQQDPIAIALHSCRLSSSPCFEAVSYTWGNPGLTRPISCGNERVEVTENLYALLVNFRDESKSRMLWVDAVCINQDDLDERSSQVMRMHLIYGAASRCIVWLGGPDDFSEVAISLIRDIAATCARVKDIQEDQLDAELEGPDRDPLICQRSEFDGLFLSESSRWIALLHFFSRPWFARIWVVQEVYYAKKVTFFCGREELTFASVFHSADWLVANLPRMDMDSLMKAGEAPFTKKLNILVMRGENIHGLLERSLVDLLNDGKQYLATDPRDKVYALMNFPQFQRDAPTMKPDYAKSVQVVYTEVATAILQTTRSLRILTCLDTYHESVSEGFPSWVPQWHHPEAMRNSASIWYDHYSAGGSSGSYPAPSASENGILRVSGFELDEIVDVCKIKCAGERPIRFTPLAPWARYEESENAIYPTKEAIVTAYAMTLTNGCHEHKGFGGIKCGPDLVPAQRVKFIAWLEQLRIFDQADSESREQDDLSRLYPPGLYSDSSPFLPDLPQEEKLSYADSFQTGVFGLTAGPRCLFRTKKGYLGLGINSPRAGDRVCVLFGGALPFVLRRKQEGYNFVGDAYVHGVMEGEAVDDWKESGSEACMFDIS